ncbi:prophage Lp1 protein 17 [Lactiplantibacillus plantarum]|nr:prophage Lp1 protein 17 [Lactiplantibacillus plantarum]
MMSLKQLDALNAAQDRMKRTGPDELPQTTSQSDPETYWKKSNDPRDWIVDQDKYLTDGDEFDKAQLFQDYIDNNDFKQWATDMQADMLSAICIVAFGSTDVSVLYPDQGEEPNWQWLIDVFGQSRLWDELLVHIDTDTMMTRLGYHWVSEGEEA